MSLSIYPIAGAEGYENNQGIRGLAYPVKRQPVYNTISNKASSGYERRDYLYPSVFWKFELTYNYLSDDPNDIQTGFTATDYQTLIGFYMARQGHYDQFLFFDPSDNLVTNGAQTLVSDSNGTYYTPLQRIMGGSNIGGFEAITDLKTDTVSLQVYANGSPTSAYTMSGPGFSAPGVAFYGLVLVWNSEPTAPITATFQFYNRCVFSEDDGPNFEWWSGLNSASVRQFNRAQSVTLETARMDPQL